MSIESLLYKFRVCVTLLENTKDKNKITIDLLLKVY